jgi:hypothetical protein
MDTIYDIGDSTVLEGQQLAGQRQAPGHLLLLTSDA